MTFRLLNSYLIVGNSISWPRVVNRTAPEGLSFTVYRWLKQLPLLQLWWKTSYWTFSAYPPSTQQLPEPSPHRLHRHHQLLYSAERNMWHKAVADWGLSWGGFCFLAQKSDDLFSRHTLDAHIRFKLNSSKTVSITPTSHFMSPYTVHLTKFSPFTYKNYFKNYLTLRGFVRTQWPPWIRPCYAYNCHSDLWYASFCWRWGHSTTVVDTAIINLSHTAGVVVNHQCDRITPRVVPAAAACVSACIIARQIDTAVWCMLRQPPSRLVIFHINTSTYVTRPQSDSAKFTYCVCSIASL